MEFPSLTVFPSSSTTVDFSSAANECKLTFTSSHSISISDPNSKSTSARYNSETGQNGEIGCTSSLGAKASAGRIWVVLDSNKTIATFSSSSVGPSDESAIRSRKELSAPAASLHLFTPHAHAHAHTQLPLPTTPPSSKKGNKKRKQSGSDTPISSPTSTSTSTPPPQVLVGTLTNGTLFTAALSSSKNNNILDIHERVPKPFIATSNSTPTSSYSKYYNHGDDSDSSEVAESHLFADFVQDPPSANSNSNPNSYATMHVFTTRQSSKIYSAVVLRSYRVVTSPTGGTKINPIGDERGTNVVLPHPDTPDPSHLNGYMVHNAFSVARGKICFVYSVFPKSETTPTPTPTPKKTKRKTKSKPSAAEKTPIQTPTPTPTPNSPVYCVTLNFNHNANSTQAALGLSLNSPHPSKFPLLFPLFKISASSGAVAVSSSHIVALHKGDLSLYDLNFGIVVAQASFVSLVNDYQAPKKLPQTEPTQSMVGDPNTGGFAVKYGDSGQWNVGHFSDLKGGSGALKSVINIGGNVGTFATTKELGVLGRENAQVVNQQLIIETVISEFCNDDGCENWVKLYTKFFGTGGDGDGIGNNKGGKGLVYRHHLTQLATNTPLWLSEPLGALCVRKLRRKKSNRTSIFLVLSAAIRSGGFCMRRFIASAEETEGLMHLLLKSGGLQIANDLLQFCPDLSERSLVCIFRFLLFQLDIVDVVEHYANLGEKLKGKKGKAEFEAQLTVKAVKATAMLIVNYSTCNPVFLRSALKDLLATGKVAEAGLNVMNSIIKNGQGGENAIEWVNSIIDAHLPRLMVLGMLEVGGNENGNGNGICEKLDTTTKKLLKSGDLMLGLIGEIEMCDKHKTEKESEVTPDYRVEKLII